MPPEIGLDRFSGDDKAVRGNPSELQSEHWQATTQISVTTANWSFVSITIAQGRMPLGPLTELVLKGLLKQYFPQALDLCSEDLWRPLATAFLLKWPTLQSLKKARKESLKQFYYLQGSRSQTLIEQRLH